MRTLAIAASLLALTACNKPAADDELEDFRPPTVQLRGDIVSQQQTRFARFDKNADGAITPNELPRRRPARVAALDTDHDGKVSKSEFVEGAIRRFDAMDANHDQQVTPDERRAARGSDS